MKIRAGKLWRYYEVSSFTEYFEHRWGWGYEPGQRHMKAAETVARPLQGVSSQSRWQEVF